MDPPAARVPLLLIMNKYFYCSHDSALTPPRSMSSTPPRPELRLDAETQCESIKGPPHWLNMSSLPVCLLVT